MTNVAKALYDFFSGFGIPAYVENNVPDNAQLPYITYQDIQPNWRDNTTIYARVWYRSTSLVEVTSKVAEIAAAVGESSSIPTPDGYVVLSKGSPWAQLMPIENDDTIRVSYLLFDMQALTS